MIHSLRGASLWPESIKVVDRSTKKARFPEPSSNKQTEHLFEAFGHRDYIHQIYDFYADIKNINDKIISLLHTSL
jgi:hypothetical protein